MKRYIRSSVLPSWIDESEFDNAQLNQIYLGIEHGLDDEDIAYIADPVYTVEEMQLIREALEKWR